MTNPEVAIVMLCLFILLVLLGFPIAFTLLAMGVAFGYFAYYVEPSTTSDLFNNQIFYLLNQNTYSVMENDTLVAIPLFLFMGYVVERANIVDRLFYSLQMAARNLPGSLAIAALITCTVFSTASGIVGAVVTLMGLLAFPAMANAQYSKTFASGVICAGGTLGILIPPSIMLIVYAAIAELSPLRLYAAAVFPGLILAGLYIVYVLARVFVNPSIAPVPKEESIPSKAQIYINLLVGFVPLTILIMLVLGSILGGLATPAEAAAMGALGGLLLATIYLGPSEKIFGDAFKGKNPAMYIGTAIGIVGVFLALSGQGGLSAVSKFYSDYYGGAMEINEQANRQWLVLTRMIVGIPLTGFVLGLWVGAMPYSYKALWKTLTESVFLTAKATAMVCWLFVGSWTFASVFSYLGGHDVIENWFLAMNLEPWQFLVLVQLIIFVLGWPLEWSEILIIFVPIFLPMLDTFGVNPYFFAMLVALNLQTSFLTPPMAMSAYYLKGVLKNQIELIEIFKGILPYLAIVIFSMVLMYQFPGIALWLPDYLFGEYIP
ncbi:MAG: TRAP transporter large permease subunit [Roseovarius sp.]|nr:TRAP transporter large permease subunit [Roseovarius sp.]MCY4208236.1 TRAP transporter large permease subunit [Roseovarius sp.]MCY4292434.1 TRAP transporter large permease subunit [Roseovarius sp.]MCY4317316.1 TRAP transporter large permease subunit [Roseovarius sp.]